MGVSWLTKTIVYSSTAVACCIAIMQYYRKKQEKNRADNQAGFAIKIIFNISSSNVLGSGQIFRKSLIDPNQMPLKVEQVLYSSKQNTLNAPIMPIHISRKLLPIRSKVVQRYRNPILLNTRFLTDNNSNQTFVHNRSISSCESGYGSSAQSGFYLTPIIDTGNSARSTNRMTKTNVLKSIKSSMLDTSKKDLKTFTINHSTDNRGLLA